MTRPKKAETTTPKAAKTTKAVKAVTKKAETTEKKAAPKTKKATSPKKEKATKATPTISTNVVLQLASKEFTYDELVQNAKNVFQFDMGGNPANVKKVDLFVKPEENKAYFVINDDIQGSYDL